MFVTDESQIEYIHIGAQKIEEVTCLKFVPYDESKHTDYIIVQVYLDFNNKLCFRNKVRNYN